MSSGRVRSISKQRIRGDAVGFLSQEVMEIVETALKLHLNLSC